MLENTEGVFPICFTVSDPERVGGVNLRLNLLVNPKDKTTRGTGQLFQPVSPRADFSLEMRGRYDELEDGKIRIVADGAQPGSSIEVSMLLESWDKPGTADLVWLANNNYCCPDDIPVRSVPISG